jgi:exodeoxyribonuclease VII large subunit
VIDRADNFAARIRRADASLRQSALRRIGASAQRAERLAFRLDRWPMTVAMRDRDRQDLDRRLAHAVRDQWSAAAQRFDALRRRLEERDVRRVAAELGARVLRAEGALRTAIALRYHRADAGARELVARLHALSPLAVLGRGYAVCWNEARTSIIRSAATVAPGDRVRVTLAEGELGCRVEERGTSR